MRESLVPLAGAVLAALSVAALADDKNKCLDARDHYAAIHGCSEIIRGDPKDAIGYYVRGKALAKNGDLGQAIADFSKAIDLNPSFAPAYDSRAAAYVAKGDYTRAVADVTKAGEVAPKKGLKAANQTPATKEKAPAGYAKVKPPAGFANVKPPAGLVKGVEVKPPASGAGTQALAKKTEQPRNSYGTQRYRTGSTAWWRARESGGD